MVIVFFIIKVVYLMLFLYLILYVVVLGWWVIVLIFCDVLGCFIGEKNWMSLLMVIVFKCFFERYFILFGWICYLFFYCKLLMVFIKILVLGCLIGEYIGWDLEIVVVYCLGGFWDGIWFFWLVLIIVMF